MTRIFERISFQGLDFTFERSENVNGTDALVVYNLRSRRYNKTAHVIVGNLTFKTPVSTYPEDYVVSF